MSINYGAASSFAIVAFNDLSNSGTVTGDVAYTTGTPPTFSPTVSGGTVNGLPNLTITDAVDAAIIQINGLTGTSMSNNDLNTEFGNTLTITGTNVYDLTSNLTNSAPFTIIGGPTDYAVFRVTGTIDFGFSIFASYPQNITFIASSNTTLANGTYSGTYISNTLNGNINISNSKIIGRAIDRYINMNSNSTIYLPGFLQITLGLAENYAMLGSQFLYLEDAGTITGFMGSDFLSYPPNITLDSNGIQLTGSIPNAPIVNGAAAKQAIDDVNTAISLYPVVTEVYNGAGGDLDIIITGPGRYTINGSLITNADVTLTGQGIYVFNVTGNITITNNIDPGNILPQNVIFIANGSMDIGTIVNPVTVSGIYISTGDFVYINNATLTGRLISTDTTLNQYHGSSGNTNSSITAP